jgi:hypothetical protein
VHTSAIERTYTSYETTPVPISREVWRHLVDAHLTACRADGLRAVFCPCGDTAGLTCPRCRDVVVVMVRGASCCPGARALVMLGTPLARWWA